MAAKKKQGEAPKFAQLPANVRKLATQLTWDPDTMPLLQGGISGFGESLAKNFGDGNWFPGKKQRFVRIAPDDSDDDIEYVVYEGGQLNALFSLEVGTQVAIACTGAEVVEGYKKPVRRYAVGVL